MWRHDPGKQLCLYSKEYWKFLRRICGRWLPGYLMLCIFLAEGIIGGGASVVWAQQAATGSGLPVPRFVTLRSGEVNVRSGPGVRYPVEWVFQRRDMPVEITAEFDTWRRIRDWEGSEGWVHQSMLSGRRAVVVMGDVRPMHAKADPAAGLIARAEPGVIGWLLRCEREWCEVNLSGYRGWMKRVELWGVYEHEKIE